MNNVREPVHTEPHNHHCPEGPATKQKFSAADTTIENYALKMNGGSTMGDMTTFEWNKTHHDILRITSIVTKPSHDGKPMHTIRLAGWDMTYTGIADSSCIIDQKALKHMGVVGVIGHHYWENSEAFIYLTHVGKPNMEKFMSLPCLYTLPKSICPIPDKAAQLISIINSMKTEPLKCMIKLILERSDRLEAFMTLPASQKDHHAYPGGLLEHSLQVANNLVAMIEMNEPNLPIEMKEAGFVAGLFHDIGKLKVYNLNGYKQPVIGLIDHDQLTLEICANGLAYLDRAMPDLAMLLRHIWTCASPGARFGITAKTPLARYLRDADGQSAMSHNHQRVSRQYQLDGFRSINNQRFWMPTLEHQA